MIVSDKCVKLNLKADVLVVGGGPSGIAAALAAAREHADVVLIEANGCLGGMATSALVGPFMTSFDSTGTKQLIKGIFDELVLRLEKEGGAIHPSKCEKYTSYSAYRIDGHSNLGPFNSDVLKRVAEQMCLESNVRILYNTTLIDSVVQDGKIQKCICAVNGGICIIEAEKFIDCTGNGDLAFLSDVPMEKPENVQPASLFFLIDGVDKSEFEKIKKEHPNATRSSNPLAYYDFVGKLRESGEYPIEKSSVAMYESCDGTWRVNMTRVNGVDATDPISATNAVIELRKQVPIVVNMLKKHIPGCKNIRVVNVADQAGFRESRRIIGKFVLTAEEMQKSVSFDDNIALCANSFDMHSGTKVNYVVAPEKPYGVPYRCLVPQNVENLLVAGRCISCTREALAAIRVMPPCFAMGEAAGVAAAVALRENCNFEDIDVHTVQSILRKNGAVISAEDIK